MKDRISKIVDLNHMNYYATGSDWFAECCCCSALSFSLAFVSCLMTVSLVGSSFSACVRRSIASCSWFSSIFTIPEEWMCVMTLYNYSLHDKVFKVFSCYFMYIFFCFGSGGEGGLFNSYLVKLDQTLMLFIGNNNIMLF